MGHFLPLRIIFLHCSFNQGAAAVEPVLPHNKLFASSTVVGVARDSNKTYHIENPPPNTPASQVYHAQIIVQHTAPATPTAAPAAAAAPGDPMVPIPQDTFTFSSDCTTTTKVSHHEGIPDGERTEREACNTERHDRSALRVL